MDKETLAEVLREKTISLETAVRQIRKACAETKIESRIEAQPAEAGSAKAAGADKQQNGTRGRRPFFFLVGAGISYPPVPLASDIERKCREIAEQDKIAADPRFTKPIDTYSYWFDQAFPHPLQRQLYLRDIIREPKTISHASFRLAHLLMDGRIANVVVTLNFDDFISRALTLFGQSFIVCDSPALVERISPEQDDVQILHVHGTYWFYDLANLRSEISLRSLASAKTNRTMAYKLDDIMERSSPLVIGYSGWEDDVVMKALERRASSTFPYRMFWFCFQPPKVESFPEWLITHPQIYFVTRSVPEQAQASTTTGQQSASADAPPPAPPPKSLKTELPAHIVLERLSRELKIEEPPLFDDPIEFFAKQLENLLPKLEEIVESDVSAEDDDSAVGDNYFIGNLVAELREINRQKKKGQLSQLRSVIKELRRSNPHQAIEEAKKINISKGKLGERQLREFMKAMWLAARSLFDNSQEELEANNMVVKAGAKLLKANPADMAARELMAKAYVNKGVILGSQDKHERGIKVFDDVLQFIGDPTTLTLRAQKAKALYNKAVAYGSVQKKDEERATYKCLIEEFYTSNEKEITVHVARATNNLAYKLIVDLKQELAASDTKTQNSGKLNLREAREMIERAFKLSPQNPYILSNLGYAAALAGNYDEAEKYMKQAIELGREKIKNGALEDSEVQPVLPQDEKFRGIVQSIEIVNPKSPAA